MKRMVFILLIVSISICYQNGGFSSSGAEEPIYFPDASLRDAIEWWLDISDPTPDDMLALTWFYAEDEGIVNLNGIEYAANLMSLDLGDNQISDISALSGLTNLECLDLGENQISDISALSGLTNLKSLDLWGNQISDISALSGLTNLECLYLGENQISDISALSGLTNLKSLDLWCNQISDISALSGLTNLWGLVLWCNQISDISALSGLKNLEYLGLFDNQISDISALSGLTNLRGLDLRVNPLNEEAYDIYIPSILKNNPGIELRYDPPPVANFTCLETAQSGEKVTFDASGSTDPDGEIVSYDWDFGDGSHGTGISVAHRFTGKMNETKTYTVTLIVMDNSGNSDTKSASVTVYPLIRYIKVYSSLSELLPFPTPPIINVTVYYNWVDEIGGQDEYIVSKVHLNNEPSLNFSLYMFSIKDAGERIWLKIHKGVGEEDVSFTYPFNEPRDSVKTIGNEYFEGLSVGPNSNLNFLVYGVEIGVGPHGIGPSFFRVSRTIELGPGKQTDVPSIYPDEKVAGILAGVASPVELRIYDSEGNFTGLVGGVIQELIPISIYDSESNTAVIFCSSGFYRYEVVGTNEGTYGLNITSVDEGVTNTFEAIDIPTTAGSIHEYTIDWEALSSDEEGVILEIDNNGDGFFEQTAIADNDMSYYELALQTETVIDFDPDTLNLKSEGKFATVYIELPEDFDVSEIDISSLVLNESVPALTKPIATGDYDIDGINDLMVKFDFQELIKMLGPGEQRIDLAGRLLDGKPFAGFDIIRVIN